MSALAGQVVFHAIAHSNARKMTILDPVAVSARRGLTPRSLSGAARQLARQIGRQLAEVVLEESQTSAVPVMDRR